MRGRVLFIALLLLGGACLIVSYSGIYAGNHNEDEADTVLRENLLPAQQGDAQAQLFVGYQYETGQGVKQNYVKAVLWYQKAAEQGNALAQLQLANMYRIGKGVPQDYILSYMWFHLSAEQGNKQAKQHREILAKNMTPQQITEAKRLAREWKPRK